MTFTEMVVDNFAGGGGASTGIREAIGREADVAINHDPEAIAMHAANHPNTLHLTTDVFDVDPLEVTGGRPVGLAWFSPDCTHFSKAKGGKPRDKNIRGLAWVVIEWAKAVRPRVIMLENVEEFRTWGPLDEDGYPIPERKGETFAEWSAQLRALGYHVEFRELRASDYGAPTIRRRLFMVARCDGRPVSWPKPTHGKGGFAFLPYRTAAECIDWSIECPSIFERKRPLADATMRRIATGIDRYVLKAEQPFIVRTGSAASQSAERGVDEPMRTVMPSPNEALVVPYVVRQNHDGAGKPADSVNDPLGTITTQHNKHALLTPFIAPATHGAGASGPDMRSHSIEEPLRTIISRGAPFHLLAPSLVQIGYGERDGQAPRALNLHAPLGTAVGSVKHALVTSFLAKHFGGHESPGSDLRDPMGTATATDHNALVSSHLMKFYGTNVGQELDAPMPTVTGQGQHIAEVRAFLLKYYGNDRDGQGVRAPLHTVTSKERFALGLVHLAGEPYQIVDIGMRMLTPRELYRAQGFPEDYIIDPLVNGKPLTKTAQIRMCGNSVCPPAARAIVAANLTEQHAWAGAEVAL